MDVLLLKTRLSKMTHITAASRGYLQLMFPREDHTCHLHGTYPSLSRWTAHQNFHHISYQGGLKCTLPMSVEPCASYCDPGIPTFIVNVPGWPNVSGTLILTWNLNGVQGSGATRASPPLAWLKSRAVPSRPPEPNIHSTTYPPHLVGGVADTLEAEGDTWCVLISVSKILPVPPIPITLAHKSLNMMAHIPCAQFTTGQPRLRNLPYYWCGLIRKYTGLVGWMGWV